MLGCKSAMLRSQRSMAAKGDGVTELFLIILDAGGGEERVEDAREDRMDRDDSK